ncbi:MAG TPA: hypothetical protein VFI06_08550 [Chitinophagaceae bacterium]|nr:hypothetical protein [Chitinophagaceae bacterium]
MTKDTIIPLIGIAFFVLYFFGTQKIYSNKYFYRTVLFILLLSLGLFVYLNRQYPGRRFQFSAFLIFHYGILLIVIKLIYGKINYSLEQKQWISQKFANKDFTFTTISDWGDEVWDKKTAPAPSWLDHVVSNIMLFGPMLLSWATVSIMKG